MGVTNEQYGDRIGMNDIFLPQCIQFTNIKMNEVTVWLTKIACYNIHSLFLREC